MNTFIEEWAPQQGILMAFPDYSTDWNYIIEEAAQQYIRLIKTFTDNNVHVFLLYNDENIIKDLLEIVNVKYLSLIKYKFNDTWTRDYGPIALKNLDKISLVDFGFNGWGLKFAADKDNLANLFLKETGVIPSQKYINNRDFILEGGSIETDGKGLILTTTRCLCSPNRNGGLSKNEVERELRKRLGAKKVLFLDYGYLMGDDTDSHVDTLARIVPDNRIVFTGCSDQSDPHYEELLKMRKQLESFTNLENEKFSLYELPLPDPIFDSEGLRLPATYANFLLYDNMVFMPTYSQPEKDKEAAEILSNACRGYRVIGIDCSTLIKQHGSLHCATMQIPVGSFNI